MSLLFGTNNYVYVPYDSGLNGITNALTVSCWVNLTAASSMQMFINRMVSATPGNEWWSLNLMNQALRGLIGDGSSVTNVQYATPMQLGNWYHCAMTFASPAITLYQELAVVASASRTLTFPADTTGIVVGANAQSAGDTNFQEFTFGYLEDMRLYSRALSATELACVRNSDGRDYIYDGLLFRLAMDEQPEGTIASGAGSVKDSGPLGMHGTPNGACVYGPSRFGLKRTPSVL